MKSLRVCAVLLLALAMSAVLSFSAFADGGELNSSDKTVSAAALVSVDEADISVTAQSFVLYESQTDTLLLSKGESESFTPSHFAKLMTALLAVEAVESGKLKPDDEISASAYAASQSAPVIWLEQGDKIAVEELFKAIIIGNANDAAAALGEAVEPDREALLELMNKRAAALGMKDTKYLDPLGGAGSLTTAYDTVLLCSELLKHEYLSGFFTTWRDFVKDGSVELVNQNTLVKSYNGITGLKACGGDLFMTCVSASRGEMSLVSVCISSDSSESRASAAEELLDYGFLNFVNYSPTLPDGLFDDITVTHGVEKTVSVKCADKPLITVLSGTSGEYEVSVCREESLEAPVKAGDTAGEIVITRGDTEVFKTKIEASDDVPRLDLARAFLALLKLIFSPIS